MMLVGSGVRTMLSTVSPLSGMKAASVRLSVAASNIANVNSNGALSNQVNAQQAYQPLWVEQTSVAGADGANATQAIVREVSPGQVPAYDPTASYANEQGMVATPNVDILNEMLNLTLAKEDYILNAQVAQTINDLVQKLFDLSDG